MAPVKIIYGTATLRGLDLETVKEILGIIKSHGVDDLDTANIYVCSPRAYSDTY